MRRTRSAAIIVLKCAVIGLGASAQQVAFSAETVLSSKPAVNVAKELIDSNVILQPLVAQWPESGLAPLSPLPLTQPDLVASASRAGDYVLEAKETQNTEVPTELPAVVQETRDVNAPVEPQSVMREIKSATRLSSSKQRRRKPKMAGIPASSQMMAQENNEPESKVAEKETRNPKMAGIPAGSQAVAQGTKETESKIAEKETRKPRMAGIPAGSQAVAQETRKPESQAVAQETKEPESQAVVQEARKPESQAVAQETKNLGSQAVAQEDEETGTSDRLLTVPQETKKTAALSESGAEVKESNAASPKKKKYAMAPVRWGARLGQTVARGSTSTTLHNADPAIAFATPNGTNHTSYLLNTQTAEVQASTYVMQPYIAQLKGDFGVVSNRIGSSITSSSLGAMDTTNDASTRSNQLFGKGDLSVYKQSRFPFTMSLSSTRDRSQGVPTMLPDRSFVQASDTTVSKSMALSQSYRALNSPSSYSGGYLLETADSTILAHTHSSWQGGYATQNKEHRIAAATRFRDTYTDANKGNGSLTGSRTNDFTLSDSFLPTESLWSFNSFGNYNSMTDRDGNGTRYLLASTNTSWQPEDENVPLFVNGSAFLFDQLQTSPGIIDKTRTLGATINANYRFSNVLLGNASGDVTSENKSGKGSRTMNQLGALTYAPGSVKLWKDSSYSWGANGSIFNGTGAITADRGVSGGVSQQLNVPYPFSVSSKKLLMSSGINQSLNTRVSRITGQTMTLINSGRVSLGAPLASVNKELGGYSKLSGGTRTSAALLLSDSHTFGRNPSRSRTVSLSLNLDETGKTMFERSGLTLEAGVESAQAVRTGTGVVAGGGAAGLNNRLVGVGSATYAYRKFRVFNVRGLDYAGSAKISRQTSYITNNASNAVPIYVQSPSFPWVINQGLYYRIGQNELSFTQSMGDQGGVKNASLWILFRAWRTIGN